MDPSQRFCDTSRRQLNASADEIPCDYSQNPDIITGTPRRSMVNNYRMMNPQSSLVPIYGTVVDVTTEYLNKEKNCVSYYDINVLTEDNQEVHFIIDANTYFVDCITQQKGVKIVGFYDELAPIPLIYPPRYPIKVIALDLPGRFVSANFFDCYLVSNDNQLQLVISNNSYIIDEDGKPYCGNISNKYMVVLYNQTTGDTPAITTPNVIIVLH
ncbi:hypothetical protein [Anaerosporobacter sp.]